VPFKGHKENHEIFSTYSLPLDLLAIPMRIMSDAKWIGRVHPRLVNFLVGLLYVGLPRNKIMLPCPRSKRSMLQPVVVVHNYFGCDKLYEPYSPPM
jgi:hypothetical protein